jgi:hypothetical protein
MALYPYTYSTIYWQIKVSVIKEDYSSEMLGWFNHNLFKNERNLN